MKFADYHTHTHFSDGKQSREEMVQAAIERDMYAIGFSDHAPMSFEWRYPERTEWIENSIRETARLKKEYAERIEIFAGLELDINVDIDVSGLDYLLEADHFIKVGEDYIPTDWSAEHLRDGADKHFGGDIFKLFSHYYEELSRAGDRGPATVAHFDVVAKFNEGECMFKDDDPRYLDAALTCVEVLAEKDVLFELNTGAIYRGYRTKPYPSLPILKRMHELGCRIILGGDSHCKEALCHKFDEALEYAALAGYKEIEKYPLIRNK